ncbi:MAG: endonuclease/exonuclease/phosphatase family protein [Blastocatellia bacterium]|nr:endonuclease/exonuclease/phosphatase family protein [Blastocatellia bacterium]
MLIALVGNLLFSVLGLLGKVHRFGELASHFRVQYFVVAVLCLLLVCCLRQWRWSVPAALCVLLNIALISPHVSLNAQAQNKETGLRILLTNVYHENKNYEAFFDLIRRERPDIIVTQETSSGWRDALKSLNTEYPYQCSGVQTDRDWIFLFSKLPLQNEPCNKGGFPPLLATIVFQSKQISLLSLHPSTPKSGKGLRSRNQQFDAVTAIFQNYNTPKIVIGDLNSSIWSPYFSDLEQSSNLSSVRKGFGILPTWPTYFPPLMIPIDHCLVSSEFQVLNCRTGPNIGSDHLPLIVDLALRN